jgi:alpha-tubulin suppressor-like RCC1 family protein
MRLANAIVAALAYATTSLQAQVSGDATITGNVLGSPLTLKTTTRYGSAVSSIVWKGKEFVNNWDHGRQLSTNASFFNRYECYNPYESGSRADGNGPTSSAKVLSLSASGNTMTSSTQMCWFLNTREPRPGFGEECGDPAEYFWQVPPYTGPLSNYIFKKTITIGFAGISNAIEYLGVLTIPEFVHKGVVQTSALLPAEFSTVRTYDIVSKTYRTIRALGGEDDSVKVVSAADGQWAMGYYTPELLQPYGLGHDGGYGWGIVPPDPVHFPEPDFACGSLTGGFRFDSGGPADFNYRSYFVIGTLADVRQGLESVHRVFGSLDPDVFNWRDYVAMNGLGGALPNQTAAANHWTSYGIAEGRVASKTFSPSQYLQLNPDVANVFGATNYAAAISHYINSGRSEGRGTFIKPTAGMQHLLLFQNRNVSASGQNIFGQLGGSELSSPPLGNSVTEVAAGDYTSFAVRSDGSLWVWGSNQYGARGDGSSGDNIATPVQVPLPVQVTTPTRNGKRAVAIGTSAYAVIDTDGQVWTWGANWNGRLGDGTTTSHYTPARVKRSATPNDYLTGIVSIASAGGTMVAIDADSNVWSWGAGANGALGNGSIQDSPYPVQVMKEGEASQGEPLLGVSQIACGSSGFCVALTRYGRVFGWGNNGFSQLGYPGGGAFSIAVKILAGPELSIDAIAAGSAHGIAHSSDGNVYGWGYNGRGQLGNGSMGVAQAPPVPMSAGPNGMSNITDLAAGPNFSIMVRGSDRAVFVTGDNQSGQLGIPGNVSSQPVPVRSTF